MADPRVPQGFLNRLNAAAYLQALPQLNVTPSYLHKPGMTLRAGGKATTNYDTMAGRVISPEPYIPYMLVIPLLRTQSLANLWKQQMESDTRLGDITIYPDVFTGSTGIGVIQLLNCAIEDPPELPLGGADPTYTVTVSGYYDINSTLWG